MGGGVPPERALSAVLRQREHARKPLPRWRRWLLPPPPPRARAQVQAADIVRGNGSASIAAAPSVQSWSCDCVHTVRSESLFGHTGYGSCVTVKKRCSDALGGCAAQVVM